MRNDDARGGAGTPSLPRKLGLGDAVFIGLGAMIGAGIFSAIAPAADAAGSWVLVALVIAAGVALCNALSSAQLAARYPLAGGTYVYGRERLGHLWGYLAGWGFVIGKVASCAAMALTFGYYVSDDYGRLLGVTGVAALTLINVLGVDKTAGAARLLVIAVLGTLAVVVIAVTTRGSIEVGDAVPQGSPPGGLGLLEGAALLFFAFAGYARIATLGEEVADPQRTIPRAIPLALAITVAVYALVIGAALMALTPAGLAGSRAPLVDAVEAGKFDALSVVVRAGAVIAALSVLLSLLAGVSRTALAMARERDLPRWLDAVHPRYQVPHRAELVIGGIVCVLVATLDLRSAIGFSSFAVLFYYAVANASAWTLGADERRWPRGIAAAGVAGCIVLGVSLPPATLIAGVALFAAGLVVFAVRGTSKARAGTSPPTPLR